jgi:hypothetical protein
MFTFEANPGVQAVDLFPIIHSKVAPGTSKVASNVQQMK